MPKTPAKTLKWSGVESADVAVAWLTEFGGSAMFRPAESHTETHTVQDDDGELTETTYEVKRPERIVYLRDGVTVMASVGDTLHRTIPESA